MKRSALILLFLVSVKISYAQDQPAPSNRQQPEVIRISIPPKVESNDYEEWDVELSAEYWALKPTGDARFESVSTNLAGDLGIEGWKSHPSAKAAIQFTRRNKLVIEGLLYRLNGGNLLERNLNFQGPGFRANDQTQSTLKLASVYAGYERDFFSKKHGFAGILAGINYLEANTKFRDITNGIEKYGDTRLAFPTLGGSFRIYPAQWHVLNFNGEMKGMTLGNYGKYLDGEMNIGLSFSRTVTLELGFRGVGTELHDKYETTGVRTTFRGPVISFEWRDR
jgi:hypothetical protein